MNFHPVLKVAIAGIWIGIGCWFAVDFFLGSTENLSRSLDVRSLSYLREDEAQSKTDSLPPKTPKLTAEYQQRLLVNSARQQTSSQPLTGSDMASVGTDSPDAISPTAVSESSLSADAAAGSAITTGESTADTSARLMREAIGISKPKPPIQALDVTLTVPSGCIVPAALQAPVPISFSAESATIRGSSLMELDLLVSEYRNCGGGIFQLSENALGKANATDTLTQMRFDELKYFFIQHSVPKSALRYPKLHD